MRSHSGEPAALIARRLDTRDRILVLGAGGWFGRTFLDLLARTALGVETMGVASHARDGILEWNFDTVAAFAPTVVVDCAYLTRERVDPMGWDAYVAANTRLTSRFLRTLALPSVRAAVAVSSGVAGPVDAETDPYGFLKWSSELTAEAAAAVAGVPLVTCRAYSVTGPFVRRPRDYAFSDLVLQAGSGTVAVRAPHEVWRRYVGVDDLLAVCTALALDARPTLVESGGPLVELGHLAGIVAHELGATPVPRLAPEGEADRYHSDDSSWQSACASLGHCPAPLQQQVRATASVLLAQAA